MALLLSFTGDFACQLLDCLTIPNTILLLILGISTYQTLQLLRARTRPPLPPGPPGEFLLGHYRIVPEDAAFKKYAEWAKEYDSDILFFETFGTKWIVLNSLESATELLEKRGSNYADRPRFVMFEEMGWSPTLTWLRWGPKYHLHRKILQPPFSKSKVGQYQASQLREALICCKSMLDDPENWVTAVRRFAVAIVLKISYGLDVDSQDSQWIKLAEESAEAIGKSGAPASSIMDRFPLTRYLPTWLPFMERLRYARTWRHAIEDITRLPFEAAMTSPPTSSTTQSFVHNRMAIHNSNLEQSLPNDFTIEDIKGAAATIVIAGNDTTSATLMLLILYLLRNPHSQSLAHSEVSSLTSSLRLPTFPDLPSLPHTSLLLQETYRLNPLSPLGIPHASLSPDTYHGYAIPKGTIIYQNVWAMNRNPAVYSDPDHFLPERYLPLDQGGRGEPLPQGNFGFGRRVCIGRHLAENSLLIVLAVMLATIEIKEPEDGGQVGEEWSFRGQAIVLPFRASFKARSERMRELLDEAVRRLDEDGGSDE
ncbi:putative cytochrome P450 E-class, group I [Cercophora samala]|uniref:Cytochrome P450 E-class, group I n=1 Tax=Cercophora samala TaxID=330535 RepID=A0AA39Z8W8_9PEZI|nr:putative cytochrome P450 E-class, group I [Cercophora samala]